MRPDSDAAAVQTLERRGMQDRETRSLVPGSGVVVAGGTTSLALPEDEARQVDRELRGLAHDLGLDDGVTWTGYRPAAETSQLLTPADAVVLPFAAGVTTRSGALAAAVTHGAPVVAAAADPPDPSLTPDRLAVLVRPRDPQALADGIRRVQHDGALAARLRRAGLDRAEQTSWARVAAEHARLYRDLVTAQRNLARQGRRVS